jgi:hypothetical protein
LTRRDDIVEAVEEDHRVGDVSPAELEQERDELLSRVEAGLREVHDLDIGEPPSNESRGDERGDGERIGCVEAPHRRPAEQEETP